MVYTTVIAAAHEAHAAAAESSPSIFEALGIDWKLLVLQGLSFLILVGLLAKFVYPPLVRAIDNRRDQIEAGLKEAKASQEAAERAEAEVAGLLAQARKEADEIIARSHQEAVALTTKAEDKAQQRAEQIVADAREQLSRDVAKARQALKAETVGLIAAATERVIGENYVVF